MRDGSGSYVTGFTTLIAFAIAGALAIALLPRARRTNGAAAVQTLEMV